MVYVFIAQGFEEIEALTPVDFLRRSKIEVQTVGVGSQVVKGSHGIEIMCDTDDSLIELNDNIEMIVLPGGMPGTINLNNNSNVHYVIDYCYKNNIYIAAICAAPSILGHKNILKDKFATCFPGFEQELIGAKLSTDSVCCDGNIITGKGAGVACDFSLKLVEKLRSKEIADKLKDSLQCKD